ncbi:uncharacterized protein LOC131317418 [Rhododendron vialii]|uniref:uncharacterized protein LOC131317418 n=1 Tax=Rhododendron vialii TaxID=182163 RepID=UPI00265EB9E2|nr:uncharacterized protein LOC131317418 [Rhododendron vialii]
MGMPGDFSLDCEVAPVLYNHVTCMPLRVASPPPPDCLLTTVIILPTHVFFSYVPPRKRRCPYRDRGLDVRLLYFLKLTPLDKSWIDIRNKLDPANIQGVEKFIEFAYDKKHPDSKIHCPCKKCVNFIFGTRSGVKEHLIINGFNTNYTRWTIHGESLASSSRNESDANQSSYFQDDMIGMVHDA